MKIFDFLKQEKNEIIEEQSTEKVSCITIGNLVAQVAFIKFPAIRTEYPKFANVELEIGLVNKGSLNFFISKFESEKKDFRLVIQFDNTNTKMETWKGKARIRGWQPSQWVANCCEPQITTILIDISDFVIEN